MKKDKEMKVLNIISNVFIALMLVVMITGITKSVFGNEVVIKNTAPVSSSFDKKNVIDLYYNNEKNYWYIKYKDDDVDLKDFYKNRGCEPLDYVKIFVPFDYVARFIGDFRCMDDNEFEEKWTFMPMIYKEECIFLRLIQVREGYDEDSE